jgi:hypothetical protein
MKKLKRRNKNEQLKKDIKEEIDSIKDLNGISLDKVSWHKVMKNRKLTLDFIKKYKGQMDWLSLSCYQELTDEFIDEFKEEIYWDAISERKDLSIDFLRKYKEKIIWYEYTTYNKLEEETIIEFAQYLDWDQISASQVLSENLIRDYKESVDWDAISESQELSESFINEFKDTVNWELIFYNQKLSFDFIKLNMRRYEFMLQDLSENPFIVLTDSETEELIKILEFKNIFKK